MRQYLYSILFLLAIAIGANAQSVTESLAGEWHFIASNNGEPDDYGIYHAGTDDYVFTASVSAEGNSLDCHSDCLYKSKSGTSYPAQWQIVVEENQDGQHRIGWVLSKDEPCFTTLFDEPRENYLENGAPWYYFGGTEDAPRYLYLLADKADESGLHTMTFWSEWTNSVADSYTLNNKEFMTRTLYAVVSETKPYGQPVGFVEIWVSPRIQRNAYDTAVRSVARAVTADDAVYNLCGQRITQPAHGLYVKGAKKLLMK